MGQFIRSRREREKVRVRSADCNARVRSADCNATSVVALGLCPSAVFCMGLEAICFMHSILKTMVSTDALCNFQ